MGRMKRLQRTFAIGIALAAILGSIGSAPAQLYPSRPITMIVPYPAGGLFDALARILAEPMRAALAQSVVIENVGGAGGSIAVGASRAPRRTVIRSRLAPPISSSSMPRSTRCHTT